MTGKPELMKKLTDALNGRGVTGACPMCRSTEWMIQDESPYSRIDVTNTDLFAVHIYRGFIPSYWLYCGNCGFVTQFMKSVVDSEGDPQSEEPAACG
jgi:hypothetical protein